jgi:transcriptional regulator with XRE-family HTH domain
VDTAQILRTARRRAGLSKRSLARRARTSAAALVEYERGRRSPTVATLDRILRAAGQQSTVTLGPVRSDRESVAARLEQVLELAEALPHRKAAPRLTYPRFPR